MKIYNIEGNIIESRIYFPSIGKKRAPFFLVSTTEKIKL